MDVRTALKNGIAQLRQADVASYTLAAELLLLHVLGRNRTWIYAHPEESITQADEQRFFALIARRIAGEPTQHLTGKQEFWGLEFEVTPDVLIPRPETEHVIEVALDRLAVRDLRAQQTQNMSGDGLVVADVGTGSGCIAIALAKELPAAKIYALDISDPALEVARRNAARLNCTIPNLVYRIVFLESDLFDNLPPRPSEGLLPLFDLIVSNPPYVGKREAQSLEREVREHEPAVALFGGEEGYEFYVALILQSAAHLKPGGILVLELGHDSLVAVRPLFDTPEWANVSVTNDLAGIPRVLSAERKS